MAIYKRGRRIYNSGQPRNKSMKCSEWDSNPGPTDSKSNTLTTRPPCHHLRISGLGCVSRKPRKAIYKNMINSFYKAVILTCLQGKKCITNRGSLMLRMFFIYRIQSNLSCSKSTRKVSGLSRNAHLVRDIRVS